MSRARRQSGLTLVEVLITVVLLTVLLVPAMRALQSSVTGAEIHAQLANDHFRLTSRMEELLAEPFGDLEAAAEAAGASTVPTSYSETAGQPGRLVVFLSLYDGDNVDADDNAFTGTDDGLIWIQVEAEGTVHSLQTVRARGF